MSRHEYVAMPHGLVRKPIEKKHRSATKRPKPMVAKFLPPTITREQDFAPGRTRWERFIAWIIRAFTR